jgi:hypothetical protein
MVATIPSEPEVINFSCHHCHAELGVPAAMAGVSGPCPSCGNTITAPLAESRHPHLVVLPPPVAEPAPLAVDDLEAAEQMEAVTEPVSEASGLRGIHVGLFEKRGFRPVRMALAVASSVAIFMSFHVMKSRRWVWEPGPDGMAGNPMPSKPAPANRNLTPSADSTNMSVAPPPANLQARTDSVK